MTREQIVRRLYAARCAKDEAAIREWEAALFQWDQDHLPGR